MSRVSGRGVLGRLLAEFAIIFVGVVLAFQFENWRQAQVDREREAEALVALAADFEANLRNLDDTLEGQRRTADALHLWLLASAGEDPGVSADSLSSVFSYAISWYGEELVSGAWDGLTSSGDVGLLRDAELRSRIAEFYGLVDSGFEDHDNEMDLLFELQSLTRTHVGPLIAPEGLPYWRPRGRRGSDPEAVVPILEIPGLHGLLAWKAVVARNRLARLELLRVQADSIVDRLEGGSTTD